MLFFGKPSKEEQARQLLIGVAELYTFRQATSSGMLTLPDDWKLGFDVELTRKGSCKAAVPNRTYGIAEMLPAPERFVGLKEDSDDGVKDEYLSEVASRLDVVLKRLTDEVVAKGAYNALMKKINDLDTPDNERTDAIKAIWPIYTEATVKFPPRAAYAAVCVGNIMMPSLLAALKDPAVSMTVPANLEALCGVLAKTVKTSKGLKNVDTYELRVLSIVEGTKDTVDPAYNAVRDLWTLKKQAQIDELRAAKKLMP